MMRQLILTVIGLIFGGALSQAPAFVDQYTQNLDGELRGLGVAVGEADRQSRRDPALQGTELLPETRARRTDLEMHAVALQESGPFIRLIEFAESYDRRVAEGALKEFEPAVPVTVEGIGTAAAGFFGGRAIGVILLGALSIFGLGGRRTA